MYAPLREMPEIPSANSSNSYGYRRKHDVHTGIDLFVDEGTPVYSMELGRVVAIQWFTGEKVNMPWWENTQRILIEGPSGVIAYCETTPIDSINEGDIASGGMMIGRVKRVLKKDKGLPMSMLHIEYYNHNYNNMWEMWKLDGSKPDSLRDPMPLLAKIDRSP